MMSEVQEKEQKHPVTLKASVHTSPATFQWTHPVTWQSPPSAGRGNVLCFSQEELQNHMQSSWIQAGPASGTCHPCRCTWVPRSEGSHLWLNPLLRKIPNNFSSWSPTFSFLTGPCKLHSQSWIRGRVKNWEQ